MIRHSLIVTAAVACSAVASPASGQGASGQGASGAGLGLVLSTHGIGVAAEVPVVPRVAFTLRGNLGTESAVFAGARVSLKEEGGLRLYADAMPGMHTCYPVGLSGGPTGCPYDRTWRLAGSAGLGLAATLGEASPWTFGVQGDLWLVEHPGVHAVVSVQVAFRVP